MWNSLNRIIRFSRNFSCSAKIQNNILPPESMKSLSEVLQEENKVDPGAKIDIGLPPSKPYKLKEETKRIKLLKEKRDEFAPESKNLKLSVDYDDIRKEWVETLAEKHIQTIAEHYNIFSDLFGDAYFTPKVVMDIYYVQKGQNLVAPVCRGNIVKPSEALSEPTVEFQSEPGQFWTLTLVNPDGHFTEENMEYIHWFVGNIPGSDLSKGEVVFDYLPPFPPRGLGFQRFIFVLYKQENKMDYSQLKKHLPCLELKDRSFSTFEFYRERQDDLTPAGLSFFQSDWDKTSKKVYHELLNMEEPVFEYDHEPKELKEQKWFPKGQPFNLYLDRYRDPKDIAKEYVLRKLKESDPFKFPEKQFPYPRALRSKFKNLPSWLAVKEDKYQLGRGRVSEQKIHEYE